MKSFSVSIIAAAVLSVAALPATPALAQRVFVAAQGSDANPCTFAAPCRTFQHAHDAVAASGEIDVLDPAGYGPLTIIKAISIQGHGFSGISVASGGTGIIVNAGATDAVNLSGLIIEGNKVGGTGIKFNSGKSLVVESCVVRNLTLNGIQFVSTAGTTQRLSVSNSSFNDNQSSGIILQTIDSGAITAGIERSSFSGNGSFGMAAFGSGGTGPINAAVTDSIASNNTGTSGIGFLAQSATSHSVVSLVLTHVKAVGNAVGVEAGGTPATLRLTQSTITGNIEGYNVNGGTMLSYLDNSINDNGSNVGSLSPASRQ